MKYGQWTLLGISKYLKKGEPARAQRAYLVTKEQMNASVSELNWHTNLIKKGTFLFLGLADALGHLSMNLNTVAEDSHFSSRPNHL